MVKSNLLLEKIIGNGQSKSSKPVPKTYTKSGVNSAKSRVEDDLVRKEQRLNLYIREHSQVDKNIATDTAMMIFGGAIGVALIAKLV